MKTLTIQIPMESKITIRINEADKVKLQKLAEAERISVSAYLRQSVSNNLNK